MTAKAASISGRHSTFAPQSSSRYALFLAGTMVASAGRLMPRRVRTMRLAPTWSAPVLPAETKASPLPSLSIFRPTTMEESFFVRMALAGSSHISMTSVQFTSSMPSREMLLSAAVLRTRASSPTPMSWTPYSFTAAAAPSSTARGALSPPIISTIIFIGFLPSWGITSPSRLRRATSPTEGRPWHSGKLFLFARGSPR